MSRKNVMLKDDAHERLMSKAKSTGKFASELASKYIKIGVDNNLQDKGWERIFNEARARGLEGFALDLERQEKSKSFGEPCLSRVFIRENYRCVKSSKTGTVKITLIGDDEVEVFKACQACVAHSNLEKRWDQILAKDKRGEYVEHTYCTEGGFYDDKIGNIKCKKQDVWQSQEVCFTIWNGKPCPSLKTLTARKTTKKKTGIQRRRRY